MMKVETISGTTPAAAGRAVVGAVVGDFSEYENILVVASLVGATGGTLDVTLQREIDNNVWSDWIHFTQLADGAAAVRYAATPNLSATAPVAVGVDATAVSANPTLASGAIAPGHPGRRVRAVAVAGVGTSAGAAISIKICAANVFS